jgi:hypothetical protein
MKRLTRQRRRHLSARSRYELKRKGAAYARRKRHRLENFCKGRQNAYHEQLRKQSAPYVHHNPPANFSLIDNPHEVLDYFNRGEELFRKKNRVTFDIGTVSSLTPDTIALMVASLHTEEYTHGYGYRGNEPKEPELAKLFQQSGFYKFVRTHHQSTDSDGTMLHKERDHLVDPDVAMHASLIGVQNSFRNTTPFEPLYEVLIECMSNANNHANPSKPGGCYWWLFVYSNPDTLITSYSFVDLGVGIFGSMRARGILQKLAQLTGWTRDISYADDLLQGKLHSRMEEDREIRGKGIPQIVSSASLPQFRRFNLITNDVYFDLKNGSAVELGSPMAGTFLYWELQPVNNTENGDQGDHHHSQGLQ